MIETFKLLNYLFLYSLLNTCSLINSLLSTEIARKCCNWLQLNFKTVRKKHFSFLLKIIVLAYVRLIISHVGLKRNRTIKNS